MPSTKKIFCLLVLFLLIFCGILACLWLPLDASNQELLANYSKMMDYLQGAESVRGWPWWTPNYNFGHSMADSLGSILTYIYILVGGFAFGMITGPKVVGLLFLFASALAMFLFVRRLQRNPWHAFVAAIIYATCPQFALRLAFNEHMVVAFCFIYPPLIFWTILNIAENRRWRDILLLSILYAAMTLTYVRTAVVFLPAMIIFSLWLFVTKPNQHPNLIGGLLRSSLIFIPLGVFPLLPFLREQKWMTLFELDAFREWQISFSQKTALSWLDRGGKLFSFMPPYFQSDHGGFYLGAVAIITFTVFFLWSKKRDEWLQSPIGKQIKFFIGLGMFLGWLAYGPRSILIGHIEFLRNAQLMPNWSIPIAWFLLYAQGFIIAKLWPKIQLRPLWITLSLVIYFLIPGFVLIEKIPFYSQVRAPWFFWEVAGSFVLAVAVGLALPLILKDIFQSRTLRTAVAISLFLLCIADFSIYQTYFAKGALEENTFKNFKFTQEILREQKNAGRVSFISGRYFYLLTPIYSGRGLQLEAFHSHFMPQWTRYLIQAGTGDSNLFRAQLNLMGISYVIIDKNDPDTPLLVQQIYRELLPVAYENNSFVVLSNKTSLAPAFLAKEFIAVRPDVPTIQHAPQFLTLVNFNYAPIAQENYDINQPDLAGIIEPSKDVEFKPQFNKQSGTPFQIHSEIAPRANYHQIRITHLENAANLWLIIPESYHPDWVAYIHDKKIPVSKAFGALLAVKIPPNTDTIIFKFEPPQWYSQFLTFSLAAWLLTLAACATFFIMDMIQEKNKVIC